MASKWTQQQISKINEMDIENYASQASLPDYDDSEELSDSDSICEIDNDIRNNPLLSNPNMQIIDIECSTGTSIDVQNENRFYKLIPLEDRTDRLGKTEGFARRNSAVGTHDHRSITYGKMWGKHGMKPKSPTEQVEGVMALAAAYNKAVHDCSTYDSENRKLKMSKETTLEVLNRLNTEFFDYALEKNMDTFNNILVWNSVRGIGPNLDTLTHEELIDVAFTYFSQEKKVSRKNTLLLKEKYWLSRISSMKVELEKVQHALTGDTLSPSMDELPLYTEKLLTAPANHITRPSTAVALYKTPLAISLYKTFQEDSQQQPHTAINISNHSKDIGATEAPTNNSQSEVTVRDIENGQPRWHVRVPQGLSSSPTAFMDIDWKRAVVAEFIKQVRIHATALDNNLPD